MEFTFCTSLAFGNIPKLLTLIQSLNKTLNQKYKFWVLCDGDDAYEYLNRINIKEIELFKIEDLENQDGELLAVKNERDRFEYNCTLRPSLILYVMQKVPEDCFVTYLDTDLYFFNNCEKIYDENKNCSILLSRHNLSDHAKLTGVDEKIVGKFNAGWISFKKNSESNKILQWWRKQCIKTCSRFPIDGTFGEQKYLDEFESLGSNVKVIENVGLNVAPWNISNYRVKTDNSGNLMVNDNKLIFYHFHALKVAGEKSFKVENEIGVDTYQLTNPNYYLGKSVKELIYKPYLEILKENAFDGIEDTFQLKSLLNFKNIKTSVKVTLIRIRSLFYYIVLTMRNPINKNS